MHPCNGGPSSFAGQMSSGQLYICRALSSEPSLSGLGYQAMQLATRRNMYSKPGGCSYRATEGALLPREDQASGPQAGYEL